MKLDEKYIHAPTKPEQVQGDNLLVNAYKDLPRILSYLHAGKGATLRQLGVSKCLLCSEILGKHGRSDGEWSWSIQISHYVKHHQFKLPEAFVSKIRGAGSVGN